MSNEFTVNLTIDLDTLLRGEPTSYDSDGTPTSYRATTLEDLVLDRVVEKLAESVIRDNTYGQSVRDRVRAIRDEVIREHIEPLVIGALDDPFSNAGSLQDYLVAKVDGVMNTPTSDNGGFGDRQTVVERYIDKHVGAAIARELSTALNDGKDQVKKALAEKGAEIMAEMLARQAGV